MAVRSERLRGPQEKTGAWAPPPSRQSLSTDCVQEVSRVSRGAKEETGKDPAQKHTVQKGGEQCIYTQSKSIRQKKAIRWW